MLKKRYHAAIAATALAFLLAGCSGGGTPATTPTGDSQQQTEAPPAAGDQAKADACAVVQASLTEFGKLSSEINASDPKAMLETFKKATTTTVESLNGVTNAEVKPAAGKAATALTDFVTYLEGVVADPAKASEMAGKTTALQEGLTELGTVCAS